MIIGNSCKFSPLPKKSLREDLFYSWFSELSACSWKVSHASKHFNHLSLFPDKFEIRPSKPHLQSFQFASIFSVGISCTDNQMADRSFRLNGVLLYSSCHFFPWTSLVRLTRVDKRLSNEDVISFFDRTFLCLMDHSIKDIIR